KKVAIMIIHPMLEKNRPDWGFHHTVITEFQSTIRVSYKTAISVSNGISVSTTKPIPPPTL
ncbi:MAG: hypothetical protein MUO95_07220, partial [Methanoregula sp.]|nr:hypothetical protein [Methanoregula sp.]